MNGENGVWVYDLRGGPKNGEKIALPDERWELKIAAPAWVFPFGDEEPDDRIRICEGYYRRLHEDSTYMWWQGWNEGCPGHVLG